MVGLFVVDVGGTLGTLTNGADAIFRQLSPLPADKVAEEIRRFLHCSPAGPNQLHGLCGALLIDPEALPDTWPTSSFEPFQYTMSELERLADIAPVVALTNLSSLGGPERVDTIRARCAPYVTKVYTSYEMGMRKPDPRLWRAIAVSHRVDVGAIVHVGDQFTNDLRGAIAAGCRAVYVNTEGRPLRPASQWPAGPDRAAVANDLRGVVEIVRRWHATDPDPVAALRPAADQPLRP